MAKKISKRNRLVFDVNFPIEKEQISKYRKEFDTPANLIIRNALAQGEVEDVVTDIDAASKVEHIFVNTLKRRTVKATCQGYSGRCWLFAGLNVFRHLMIEIFDLKDFEFSGTYLYFWDKVERSNRFLDDILSTVDVKLIEDSITDSPEQYFLIQRLKDPISDGGDWDVFANLVAKYGLIPKNVMPERTNSYFSDDFNQVLNSILRSHAYYIRSNYRKMGSVQLMEYKNTSIQQIYDVCVKFLGKPPEKFDWSIQKADPDLPNQIANDLTPKSFGQVIFNKLPIFDFVAITNLPNLSYQKYYQSSDNYYMSGRKNIGFLNLPIRCLQKYAYRSIISHLPVYFTSDVAQDFHQRTSAFSKDVIKNDLIFGKVPKMNKGDRNRYYQSYPNHSMSLIGADVKKDQELPFIWQVENSWGFSDNETPGEDGFYVMTDDWFQDHVYQIVVHRNLLDPKDRDLLNTQPSLITISDIF